MLTEAEHRALDLTAELMRLLSGEIVSGGPSRARDLAEAAQKIHAIQHMILAQSAARAHPERYRLLGEQAT